MLCNLGITNFSFKKMCRDYSQKGTVICTCEKVSDEFVLVFFAANIREDTNSLALEQRGVITKDT